MYMRYLLNRRSSGTLNEVRKKKSVHKGWVERQCDKTAEGKPTSCQEMGKERGLSVYFRENWGRKALNLKFTHMFPLKRILYSLSGWF